MHCSANTDPERREHRHLLRSVGTGKTTLSTIQRLLIGDDKHGWDDNGVFLRGRLLQRSSTWIRTPSPISTTPSSATLCWRTLLWTPRPHRLRRQDRHREHPCLPHHHIRTSCAHLFCTRSGKNIIFLSADAFGVLPPVSIHSPGADPVLLPVRLYRKLAASDRGITEPSHLLRLLRPGLSGAASHQVR